jgi:hypothetical protein
MPRSLIAIMDDVSSTFTLPVDLADQFDDDGGFRGKGCYDDLDHDDDDLNVDDFDDPVVSDVVRAATDPVTGLRPHERPRAVAGSAPRITPIDEPTARALAGVEALIALSETCGEPADDAVYDAQGALLDVQAQAGVLQFYQDQLVEMFRRVEVVLADFVRETLDETDAERDTDETYAAIYSGLVASQIFLLSRDCDVLVVETIEDWYTPVLEIVTAGQPAGLALAS